VLGCPLVEASGRALGQARTEGLHGSPNVVHKLRAAPDQCLTRADDRQVSLGVLTAVFEWIELFRIHSCEASEVLGVYLIRFALACVDEAHFARIAYHYLMATLLEEPANPG
jgi:hypothetical protein